MRTISWTTQPLMILFAAAIAAGCGSDSPAPAPAAEAGTKCGNGKIDTGEVCDGTQLGGKTCATAMLTSGTVGSLKCSADCKTFATTSCNKGTGGAGGTTGAGGAPVGNGGAPAGGSGGKGSGGKGGSHIDGGADSGSTGGTGGGNPVDAGKG